MWMFTGEKRAINLIFQITITIRLIQKRDRSQIPA